jgi:hypothetical protein
MFSNSLCSGFWHHACKNPTPQKSKLVAYLSSIAYFSSLSAPGVLKKRRRKRKKKEEEEEESHSLFFYSVCTYYL